ncbi:MULTISPECIES: ATP-binding protein [unclassified Microcoleus]|uniref:ATP-binding protein n=1 Tax=unclassified Microcoleus TaxID=2642155 RepID=UPI002FD74CBD
MKDNINDIPSGGIGIKIIGKIADELSYTRISGRNCLFIIKYYESQHNTQAGCWKRAINILNSFNWLQEQREQQSDRNSHQPLKKISLKLNTDIKAVTEVLLWFEQLEDLPIPEAVFSQFKLIAIEGFTNVVRHAHKNLPLETPIELVIAAFNDRLELEIWDSGEPFDFKSKLEEELSEKSPFSWDELAFTLH